MQNAQERTERLAGMLVDSRKRTLELVSDLSDEQMIGPQLSIVNPPLWEIGHLAWFQERWNLRRRTDEEFAPSTVLERGDEFYDSMEVAHDDRWDLPLLSREATLSYMQRVLDETLHRLDTEGPTPETDYFVSLAAFHEDMHGEAFTYTRQTHGLPAPPISEYDPAVLEDQPRGPLEGDAEVPGEDFMLGATEGKGFVFDNEKWAHPVQVSPFEISRTPVTNEQFRLFVDDGAYKSQELWSEAGLRWLEETGAEHPVYWSRVGDEWHQRHFDRTGPLNLHAPVFHVNWYEAEAYCRWAGRRLPTEVEWEMAASAEQAPEGTLPGRTYPWGETPPGRRHANLDGRLLGPVDVAAFADGDSAFGCRQMMGNVWEWCADDFGPYPGFVRDPYKEYSEPWFGDQKVQRGGSWATRGRMLRNTWRNFALPDRRDLFVGFRTCALE